MNNDLAICIPTYNRASQLKGCLEGLVKQATKHSIAIYISDNASTDGTRAVVEKYAADYPNIIYSCNDQNYGHEINFSRVLRLSRARYSWLLGDDDRIMAGGIENVLEVIARDEFDLVVVNGGRREGPRIRGRVSERLPEIYSDQNRLLADLGWHMTWMSCLVFSQKLVASAKFEKYYDSHLVQCLPIFEYLAGRRFLVGWEKQASVYSANYDLSGWYPEFAEIWLKLWSEFILALPDSYSPEAKLKCIKAHGVKSGALSARGLIRLRLLGYYNFEVYGRYRQYWPQATDVPDWALRLIAKLPVPGFLSSGIKYWRRGITWVAKRLLRSLN